MGVPRNRTAEIEQGSKPLEVSRKDYCSAYLKDSERLFTGRECWFCKYGDFGILTEHPTENGICRYGKESINRNGNFYKK